MKEGYDLMLQNKFSDGNQIEIIIFRLMLWLESCYICMLIVTTVIMVISSCKKKYDIALMLNTRCGRVMADNIAYAKFRKSLLI